MSRVLHEFNPRLARRRRLGLLFPIVCASMAFVSVAVLAVLVVQVFMQGRASLSSHFLTNFPSVLYPEKAGVKSALWGTFWMMGLTTLIAVPIGIGSAVYLEEYALNNRLTRFIRLNIANLAGVPSIVYGILGLAAFVRWMHLGRSVLAGALTVALLVMPVIVIASREALAAVPQSVRQAAFALGATRWQTVRSHVLPAAIPGIMTGMILALSRAIGEAAPLIMIGALTYVAFVPEGPLDSFTAMPIQIYDWSARPQTEFHQLAAAGIIVLLGILLPMNAIAVGIRAWHQRGKA